MRKLILFVFLLPFAGSAQQLNIPFHPLSDLQFQVNKDRSSFTSLKPLLHSRNDSVNFSSYAFTKDKAAGNRKWLRRKLFRESFIVIDTGDFRLSIDPLLNVAYGKGEGDDKASSISQNSRGLLVKGEVGSRFAFETSFLENQSFYPAYLSSYTKAYGVSPGQGRVKKFKTNGYDYAYGSGYISFSPSKVFNLQLGHGKHFVGEGYRSLLLSDNAFNYPFLKPSFQYKWIKYDVIYSSLMILHGGKITTSKQSEPIFRKKPGTFHLLTVKPLKQVEIGFFEGTIFKAETPGKPESWAFINPLIFLNSASYGLNDNDNNVLTGITGSVKPIPQLTIYGQLMYDGKIGSVQKAGYQAGVKFNSKRVFARIEYNTAELLSYNASNTYQAYEHYNQPLAHTLGSDFSEIVVMGGVRIFKGLFITGKLIKGNQNAGMISPIISDTSSIFSSFFTTPLLYATGTIEYVLNPRSNLSVYIEANYRKTTIPVVAGKTETAFIYAGIRTNLFNIYRDF